MKFKFKRFNVYFLIFLVCTISWNLSAEAQQSQRSGRSAKPISYGTGREGVLFDVGLYYGQSQATADPVVGNEWKNNASIYDIKLGYIFGEGYYAGAEYSTYNQSTAATLSTPAMDTTAGGGAGAGLGYFWSNGFHLRAFYRLNETFGDYKNGSGYQADLGYMVNLSSSFYLGLLLSNRQITFKENRLINNFNSWTKKETYPFITLGFVIK